MRSLLCAAALLLAAAPLAASESALVIEADSLAARQVIALGRDLVVDGTVTADAAAVGADARGRRAAGGCRLPHSAATAEPQTDSQGNVVIARVDYGALRAVADAGGGRLSMLDSKPDPVSPWRASDGTEFARRDDGLGDRWRDAGPWFLLLVLPVVLLVGLWRLVRS